jgi:hypothetical protein
MEDKGEPLSQTSEIWVNFQDFTYDLFLGGCCQDLAWLVPYPYLSLRALRAVATRGNPP